MKHKMAAVGLTALLSCSTSLAGADYTPTLGDNSVYDITRIDSAEGSDFSLVEINDDGTSSITYYQYKIKDGAQSGEQIHDDLEGADVNNNFFGLTGDNGAAIFNRTSTLINPEWKIGNVTGDFVNNRVDGSVVNGPQGGAIYNRPASGGTTSIGNITGDFINNTAASDSVWPSYGGAIYNSTNALGQTASIGDITGNFIGNSATNTNNHAFGGAIYNYSYDDGVSFSPATLGVISGSFIGNYVEGTGLALGGAIYTSGNLTIASKGKNIEFAGNYAVTDGNRINNAIFMDTIIDGSTLTFDVSGGGQIWFLDQIDGGEVNGTGTGVEYDRQYSLIISGNGTTVGSGRIFFADTINNTATVTVNNAVMTMGSYDGHHGNFSQPDGGTADVTLNDGHLDLDYDGYQTLSLNSLTATGNSFLSFGADFHGGKADQLNTANLTGDYGLGAIHMDNFGNIGESVTVFADAGTTFNNLDTYTGIYNNIDYKFEQNGSELSVIFKDLVRAESIVVEEEILEVADKELNNLTGGILDNSGTTTINKGSFSGNSNDNTNGGVFANHGSLTLTEVDFADNSSGKDGGAIYNDGSLGETLSGSNYSGNTAAGSGGAIYNAAAGTIGNIAGLSATNSFSNNTAGESGGAIYNDGSLASVTGFSFTGNRVAGGTLALGGAVYTSDSMLFDSDGKYIEFSGNSVENAAGETTNNAIFVNTADGAPVLTFDVSKGGGIIFADEIDGGAVNADRTGIDYDKQYSVVLKGNGSGKDAAEISFADTINNASALTADKINLTLTGASGSFGNFGSKGTDLSLNDSHLKLNYAAGEYQQLTIGNLSVTGNSYLSFGANFLKGASDSLNIAGVSGELQIYDIRFDYSGNVGDSVTLFDNAAVTINNLDSYTKIYNNLDYTFRQEGGKLVIASKNLVRAESVVEKGEILDIQDTVMNDYDKGILTNHGTTNIVDSSFADNSNDNGNGGVIANDGSLTITNTDFTGNSTTGSGGAIYSTSDLTLIADNDEVVFDGNADGNGGNDIYMGSGSSTLYIIARNNGTASFGSGINGENGYQINISGDTDSSVVFTAAAENAASLAVRDTTLIMRENASFGTGSTAVALDGGRLELDYDDYHRLTVSSLTTSNNAYLSFGANFNKGMSDSLDIASAAGELGIYNIRFDGFGNIGDTVTLFDNAVLTINNLDKYTKIYNNIDYKFAQNGNKVEIVSKELAREESVVEKGEILDIQATELNGKTNGILDNSGTTLMEDGRFDGNSHDGNGSVVNNKGTLVITNSAFTNNSSKGTGGAIHNAGNLILIAEDGDITFAGNTDGSGANDIFMAAGTTLNIRLTQNGTATFDGGINGENGYTVNITGDNSGALVLDGSIQNSGSINVSNTEVRLQTDNLLNGQILALTNSRLNLANNTIGTLTLNGYRAKNAELWLDVDTANNVADVLNIKGELTGTTGLIVNMLSDVEQTADIVFANTPDDTDAKDGTFVISRLVGQPYQYNLNVIYDPSGKQWLFTNQEIEPEPETRTVAPEFVAYAGLMQASVEQTRGLHAVVAEKVAANKLFSENCCGVYDEAFDGKTLANAWVVTDYRQADSERPVDMEADIWGITGGFDIQTNAHNKIGVFAAYRQGEYELSGKGRSFSSTIGSKIDIDSYLGGLYYRYDRSRAYLTATAFGGIQKADLKTDDGAVRTDTDGHQFGAAADAGYVFALSKTVTLEPSVGIFYTMTDYDDIRDRVGNTARFDTVNYAEAEAGIKLEKTFFFDESAAKLHLKPTFVQTFGDNDNVYIDNLPDSPALRDQTLGRIEIGGRYGFGGSFSVFGWGSYTFGSRYEATAFGAGMSFSW